jgi:hypothetical protein
VLEDSQCGCCVDHTVVDLILENNSGDVSPSVLQKDRQFHMPNDIDLGPPDILLTHA